MYFTDGPGLSVEILPLNSISVSENETIENITCSATCNPVCSYIWQKPDGNHVADNNLELGAAHRDMSGTYLCTAENEIQSMTLQGFARLSLLVYCKICFYKTNMKQLYNILLVIRTSYNFITFTQHIIQTLAGFHFVVSLKSIYL